MGQIAHVPLVNLPPSPWQSSSEVVRDRKRQIQAGKRIVEDQAPQQIQARPAHLQQTSGNVLQQPDSRQIHTGTANLQQISGNVLSQPTQVLALDQVFARPSQLIADMQRFIMAAIDSALDRTQASSYGQNPPGGIPTDGFQVDSQTREEDRLAWQQLAGQPHIQDVDTGPPQAEALEDLGIPQAEPIEDPYVDLDEQMWETDMGDPHLDMEGSASTSGERGR